MIFDSTCQIEKVTGWQLETASERAPGFFGSRSEIPANYRRFDRNPAGACLPSNRRGTKRLGYFRKLTKRYARTVMPID